MENFINFLKEKKLIIIVVVVLVIILLIIAKEFKKEEKVEQELTPERKNWSIDSVDESTNDPFAEQYQNDFIEEQMNENGEIE